MTPDEARRATADHISRVEYFLSLFALELGERAKEHDASKLESPEVEMFSRVTEKLQGLTYGSSEYEAQRKKMLGMALRHHYEHNRHHPEHFDNGVSGMSLIDLVEMFCDHLAACERHKDGDPYKSLEINTERFGYSPQLVSIFRNTIDFLREVGD